MLGSATTFSSFAVDDVEAARAFYADVLGLDATVETSMGLLQVSLPDGHRLMIYPKPDYAPATYTVLNFVVPDVAAAVGELRSRGVETERYEGFEQDEAGVSRAGGGPAIAWFSDPAGNILAVLETGD